MKEGIEIVYVENVGQVIEHAFAGTAIANNVPALPLVSFSETA